MKIKMKITNTDWYLRRGIEHTITEDYALTNNRELVYSNGRLKKNIPGPIMDEPFAIVCDGCSSSPHTDVGARILAHHSKTAKKILRGFGETSEDRRSFYTAVWGASHTTCANLNLPYSALDATILTAHVNEKGQYRMCALGDGVMAGRTKSGEVIVTSIEFPSNAPIYLRLLVDPEQYAKYCSQFGTKIKVATSKLTPFENGSYDKSIVDINEFDLPETNRGVLWVDTSPTIYSTETMEAVAIYSDGASSFQQYERTATGTRVTSVPMEDIIWETMSFKKYGGNFVHARCDKAFAGFEKQSFPWRNLDDFSMAAIHVNYKKETSDARVSQDLSR